MTAYSDQLARAYRTPLWLVTITTAKRCANIYADAVSTGTDGNPSTCAATDLGDGARCFYSYRTCQDRDNFRAESFTWYFSSANVLVPPTLESDVGKPIMPVVDTVGQVSEEIDVLSGKSHQGKLRLTMIDLGSPDAKSHLKAPAFDTDKSTRNTGRAGTFWRRWLRQWPNFRGMDVTVKRGFYTPTFGQSDFQTYFTGKIESVNLRSSGGVQIEIEDFLAPLARKIPRSVPTANAVLSDMSRSATTVSVDDASVYTDPTTLTRGYTAIEIETITGRKERMKVTAIDTGANTLTVTRGSFGTTAEPIRAESEIKEVLDYKGDDGLAGVRVYDCVLDMLEYAGVPTADIDTADIASKCAYIGPARVNRLIDEPKTASDLIFGMLEPFQANIRMTEASKVSITVNRHAGTAETVTTVTDAENVVAGSHAATYNEERRRTHCAILYDFPLGKDGERDARKVVLSVNGETFVADYYGTDIDDKFAEQVKSHWISSWDTGLAVNMANSITQRFAHPPLKFRWTSELRDAGIEVGDIIDVTSGKILDEYGAQETRRLTVTAKKALGLGGFAFVAEFTGFHGPDEADGVRYAYIAPSGQADYDSASSTEQADYIFIGDSSNLVGSAGVDGYYLP